MAITYCFDTTFLIDLQKEGRKSIRGPAHSFLAMHTSDFFAWSVVALGEFAEGFRSINDPALQAFLRFGELYPIDADTALIYSQITRQLRGKGKLIGTNDLWIASTALRHQNPLVTGNMTDFAGIPGLQCVNY